LIPPQLVVSGIPNQPKNLFPNGGVKGARALYCRLESTHMGFEVAPSAKSICSPFYIVKDITYLLKAPFGFIDDKHLLASVFPLFSGKEIRLQPSQSHSCRSARDSNPISPLQLMDFCRFLRRRDLASRFFLTEAPRHLRPYNRWFDFFSSFFFYFFFFFFSRFRSPWETPNY